MRSWIGIKMLVSIVNHAGESAMVYSRICSILFLHLGMKFTSDREDLLIEMFILISLVILQLCERGENLGNK